MSSSTSSMQRLDALTSLRGILAIWVVLYHFSNDISHLFPALQPLEFLWHGGGFAVPGFFILSGYVLSYTYAHQFADFPPRGLFRFWSMRLARIYPVHFVTLMAVLAMVLVGNRAGLSPNTPEGYSVRDFWLNLFLVHTWVPKFQLNWNYPSWSISSEWFAYLLFPFVAIFLAKIKNKSVLAIVLLLCMIASAVVYSMQFIYFRELICVIPTFLGGMALYTVLQSQWLASSTWPRWAPDLISVLIIGACALASEYRPAVIIIGLYGVIAGLAILKSNCNKWWTAKSLIYVGEISYSLYMTHTIAQKILYKILPVSSFIESGFPTRLGVFLLYGSLVIALCLLTYYLVERPSREWMRRYGKRN